MTELPVLQIIIDTLMARTTLYASGPDGGTFAGPLHEKNKANQTATIPD